MANKIILKKSSVASKVPLATDLEIGEIAVNLADQKLYSKNASGSVVLVGSAASGSGTVTSVNASGNTTGLTFSGGPITTSGTLTMGGTLVVANGGTGATTASGARSNLGAAASGANSDITSLSGITGNVSTINQASFATSPTGTTIGAGQVFWNSTYGTMSIGMDSNVAGLNCQSEFFYIKASSAISIGQVVMFTGAVGASGVLTGAPATSVTDGSYIMGIAAENIALNKFGYIQAFGVLKGFDTSAFAAGSILWYDTSVTGGLTTTKPSAPNVKVQMAVVINSGTGGSGSVFVRVSSGSTLGGTDSNVQFGTLATNNLIQYNGTYWSNIAPSSLTGVGSVANSHSAGTGLSGTAFNGSAAQTWTLATAYGDSINPYGSKTANYFLAAPNGSAGTPSFRAIVAADIPTLNQNTTGTASNVTGVVAIANGGSGTTTAQGAMNAFAGAVTSGSYLRGNGTNVVMSTIQAADVPTLNQNTTGSAAKWTTARTESLTGDITGSTTVDGSANWSIATTLATVNANVGSFGSSSAIPVVTVNAKGLVTAVSTATVAGGQYFGTAAVKAIAYNANSIAENVTVTAGNNGLSAGPISISSGFTVTVESGANWVIV